MSFRLSQALIKLFNNNKYPIEITDEGTLSSREPYISEKLEDLDFISNFKVPHNLIFEYLIGKKDVRIYSLKGKRKKLQKGRIIGTRGKTIRGLANKTKTRIFTLNYKFLILGAPENSLRAFEVIRKIGIGRSYECSFRSL